MKESNLIFQSISLRRRVAISIGFLTILILVVGLYGIVAIRESSQRLHRSIVEGQAMAEAVDTARLSQVHFKKQVQEWKNILLRGNDKELFNKHLKAFNDEEKLVSVHLKSLSQMADGLELSVPQIADIIAVHEKMGHRYREALAKYQRHDLKSAVLVDYGIRGIDRELTDEIDDLVSTIKTLAGKRLKDNEMLSRTQIEAYYALSFFIIFLIIAGLCIGIFNAWSITKDLPPGNHDNNKPDGNE